MELHTKSESTPLKQLFIFGFTRMSIFSINDVHMLQYSTVNLWKKIKASHKSQKRSVMNPLFFYRTIQGLKQFVLQSLN